MGRLYLQTMANSACSPVDIRIQASEALANLDAYREYLRMRSAAYEKYLEKKIRVDAGKYVEGVD